MAVDRILTRPLKANLSLLRHLQEMRKSGRLKFSPEALERGRRRAKKLIDDVRRARRNKANSKRIENLKLWEECKKRIRKAVSGSLAKRPMRSPDQVLGDLVKRVKRLPEERKAPDRATIVVRAAVTNETEVLKKLRSLSSGAELVKMGLEVRAIKVGKGSSQYYEIKLPVRGRHLGKEILNLAWALKKGNIFEAAWPGERKLWVFSGEPTHASRAPGVFAWHIDMIRGRQAHELKPGNRQGSSMGKGIVVAHPDTGWAPHPEYNQNQIDIARSHNVMTDETGGQTARHSIRLEDRDAPNITHGTATGSLIIGGPPSDRPDIANVPEEDLEFSEILGGRNLLGENPQVDEGHILGVAPLARILPIRFISNSVLDWDESGMQGVGVVRVGDARFVDVLDYAVKMGADVMSLSVGGIISAAVRDAFDNAILNEDLIVVAAAGQTYLGNFLSVLSAEDSVVEPACFQNVIAVAGCSVDGRPWDESHRGPNVDITAPCDAIWVADFDRERVEGDSGNRLPILQAASGTSFAAAIMAGAAALWLAHWGGKANLKERYPNIPLSWVFREMLQRTARPVFDGPWDAGKYGPGIVNLELMLKEPLPNESDIPEPPATVGNLLTWFEEGMIFIDDIYEWLGDRYREVETGVQVGIAVVEALVTSALKTLEEKLAEGYAAMEEAGEDASEGLSDAVKAGEQLVEDSVDALEDLGEAAVEGGKEVGEKTSEFVSDVVEGIGEVADTVAGWLGL
jgi:hypothetical protein